MLRLALKKARKNGEQNLNSKRSSPALIRITKDVNELKLPQTCRADFPNKDDLFNFKVVISPDDGFYRNGEFVFDFKIPPNYPYDPPKVKCLTDIYHPNIDLEGNICLNILREDWKPVLSIESVVHGLQYLLLEPNHYDPLNKNAADFLKYDPYAFAKTVKNVISKRITAASVSSYCHATDW